MKKIMTALPAVALCGAVSADVTSANTVGYMTAQVAKANYKTFSVSLTDCAAPEAPVKIDKLLSGEFTTATSFAGSDQIWRWDTTVNQWAKYSYSKLDRKGEPAWRKYLYLESTPSFADLTDADKLLAGEGFPFFRAGNDPITVTWKPLQSAE